MKATIDLTTGLLIESQCIDADDDALIDNATGAGYSNVEVRIVTDAELKALIAARDIARKTATEHAADKATMLKQARDLREIILNRLTGIRVNTSDATAIAAIQAARQALLDFTADAAVVAAVTGAETKTAVMTKWYVIAAALTAAAPSASDAFKGMGLE